MKIIGRIYTDFPDKFGLPRQSGLAPIRGRIVFDPPYNSPDAFRGIERFSHIWLLWRFDGFEGEFSPTVRPPRLGGNARVGVFATRSPNRPNPIGMSVLRLVQVEYTDEGVALAVEGVDMMSGTAVYDVKPYLAYADSVPRAEGGFAAEHMDDNLTVGFAAGVHLSADDTELLKKVLSLDPRPHYHEDGRVYGMRWRDCEVRFVVEDKMLHVLSVEKVVQ